MKPGPKLAYKYLQSEIGIDTPPRKVVEVLTQIILKNGWAVAKEEALETAENWSEKFLRVIESEIGMLNELGRPPFVAVNSSSGYMLQGVSFVEPGDPTEVREAKIRRSTSTDYLNALQGVSPSDFEAVCKGILSCLGAGSLRITRKTRDEGIDFFGQLRLENRSGSPLQFRTVERQLKVWLVGQAKRFIKNQVSTFEVRELVGSVQLARASVYSSSGDKYPDLKIRPCDPVFFLLFTTGVISRDTWKLVERSGVVCMDGEMVAGFLAENGVATVAQRFNSSKFMAWINAQR